MTEKPQKKWCHRPYDQEAVRTLVRETGVSSTVAVLMAQRGIDTPEAAADFLNPSLDRLPSPFLMKDMERAVAIVVEAVRAGRPITVYGDYDVDGTSGVAVLALFLRELGIDSSCCQPQRFSHGYGLHADLLDTAVQDGLLITVDCGISDADEVARAREKGWTVVVTDHHQPPERLPAADAVLNPLQPGCDFPFKHLAGVGVAFYLAMGVRSALRQDGFWQGREGEMPNLKSLLDLVAIGSICDMVPLVEVNRVLCIAGLAVLSERQRPGLRQLLRLAGVNGRQVAADDVGYRIGPRLNAPGRLGSAAQALEVLLTDDEDRAGELATAVDAINRERQQLVEEQARQALEAAEMQVAAGKKTLVLHQDDWHGGVLGIVASRLIDTFAKPTILLRSDEDGLLKGSGRSVEGFDLHAALTDCAELLEAYGGHTCAAGLTLRPENLAIFADRFEAIADRTLTEEMVRPVLWIDYRMSGEELGGKDFLNGYQQLAPFGVGNPEPVFAVPESIQLVNAKMVGRDHLRFSWRVNGSFWNGIGFGFGHLCPEVSDQPAQLAFTVRRNCFRGREEWQLNAVDICTNSTT